MRSDLKVTVYDRMTDPNFRWIRHACRNTDSDGNVGYCAWGVVIDEFVKAGYGQWIGDRDNFDYAQADPTKRLHILNWADMTIGDMEFITEYNDSVATGPADIAEVIKNLPDRVVEEPTDA